ncbi:MAG: tRNA (adenosine(37)-N6)-threonylcarbamoyltransferase complex transferase subunit TsaD [Elusimicrobiales bacterium]
MRLRVLGIETTCDETAAAVYEDGRLLSDVVWSQVPLHRRYKGVVPELASRAHCEKIAPVIAKALKDCPARRGAPVDAVAFARGPGLAGGLVSGSVAAQTVGGLYNVPVMGVNHLEGHLYSCEFTAGGRVRALEFPLLALIISGGHTELWHVKGYGRYRRLGKTRDDAAGEAFDKVAKLLGLDYPGGPAVEAAARGARRGGVVFPRPMLEGSRDFSFSGLKTAVSYHLRGGKPAKAAEICAAFQDSVIETVTAKTLNAARDLKLRHIAVGGGVAANGALREYLSDGTAKAGMTVRFVERKYCSDNGAMAALCGWHMLRAGCRPGVSAINPALEVKNWIL